MAQESKAQLFIYKVLNPLIVLMHKIGITPNMITSFGFILNIVAAVIFIVGGEQADRTDMFYVGWGGFTILIAGLFDMMDGRLARVANLSSSFGAFYDSVMDRYSELIMFLGICFYLISQDYFLSSLFAFVAFPYLSQEICDNGIDDDLDGLIDLQDTTDCFCKLSIPDSSISTLIPNPSFEQRTCCPSMSSQMNCVDNWIQATGATADYFNSCGLLAVGTFPPPPLPLPNGTGYVGFFDNFGTLNLPYKEYIGTCLNDTTKRGVNYQLDYFISNSLGNLTTEIAIYGTTDCANLPFGSLLNTSSSFCPTTVTPLDWTLLAIDTVTCSSTSWVGGSLNFTATQNYSAIVIGGSCRNNPNTNYYFLDCNTIIIKINLDNMYSFIS